MSEGFEVRGAHDEAVDERAERREPLSQRIALFSAVLATVGAVVSLLGGHTENDALYQKNEAVLLKARASDSWSYYQAEEVKRHLIEATQSLTHDPAAPARIAAYAARSRALQREATALDERSAAADEESRQALRPHVKLSIAVTFVQIAIALASITALTRRGWLFALAAVAAAIGIALAALAWL